MDVFVFQSVAKLFPLTQDAKKIKNDENEEKRVVRSL